MLEYHHFRLVKITIKIILKWFLVIVLSYKSAAVPSQLLISECAGDTEGPDAGAGGADEDTQAPGQGRRELQVSVNLYTSDTDPQCL